MGNLAIKKNEVLTHATMWMDLKHIRVKDAKYNRIGKSIQTESRQVVARGWGEWGIGSDWLMGLGFPYVVIKTEMFWNLIKVVVAKYYKYNKCY